MRTTFRPVEQQRETTFARRMATALMCAVAVGVLLGGIAMRDDGGLVQEAVAAPAADAGERGHFPAQFPAPRGAPEPHIEAF